MSESLPLCHFAKANFESIKVSKFHDKKFKKSDTATQRHGENSKEMRRSY